MTRTDPQQQHTVLVLGATGGIGGAVARTFAARGWHVRAMARHIPTATNGDSWEWRQGDAMVERDVTAAAQGAEVIVHAVNPPGYRDWEKLVLPMLANTITAAKAVGARIVLPGTIYNFGPDACPTLTETSPQHPLTKKGSLRVDMERRLEAAAAEGTGVIIVRAGDFFGPGAANNWFSGCLVTQGKPVTTIRNPARGVGHHWAYLPDVAETMVRLVERADELPRFARFHMAGIYDSDGTEMVAAIRRVVVATGAREPKVAKFPWWIVPVLALVMPFMRELREMRYLWRLPLRMPNDELVRVLGSEPHTPLDEAVLTTLRGLGCLPAPAAAAVAAG